VWLSLVERCLREADVAGSNPVTPTVKSIASIARRWRDTDPRVQSNLTIANPLDQELRLKKDNIAKKRPFVGIVLYSGEAAQLKLSHRIVLLSIPLATYS
jgi:hypothetical protein